jgi:hypothetical protein
MAHLPPSSGFGSRPRCTINYSNFEDGDKELNHKGEKINKDHLSASSSPHPTTGDGGRALAREAGRGVIKAAADVGVLGKIVKRPHAKDTVECGLTGCVGSGPMPIGYRFSGCSDPFLGSRSEGNGKLRGAPALCTESGSRVSRRN